MKVVTVEQMQALEAESESRGVSTDRLMENAGLAIAPEPIRLEEGESAEQTLILNRGVDVDGAFELTGAPDRTLDLHGPYHLPQFYLPVWATRAGTYHLRGLPPGDWTLSAGSWAADNEVEFVVRVGEDLTVRAPTPRLDFPPRYTVSGQVRMHGEPLVGLLGRFLGLKESSENTRQNHRQKGSFIHRGRFL